MNYGAYFLLFRLLIIHLAMTYSLPLETSYLHSHYFFPLFCVAFGGGGGGWIKEFDKILINIGEENKQALQQQKVDISFNSLEIHSILSKAEQALCLNLWKYITTIF